MASWQTGVALFGMHITYVRTYVCMHNAMCMDVVGCMDGILEEENNNKPPSSAHSECSGVTYHTLSIFDSRTLSD